MIKYLTILTPKSNYCCGFSQLFMSMYYLALFLVIKIAVNVDHCVYFIKILVRNQLFAVDYNINITYPLILQ